MRRTHIDPKLSRIIFKVACPALTLVYLLACTTAFVADHFATSGTTKSLERAIHLQPGNADYHHRLGYAALIQDQDTKRAIAHLQRAVELDRFDARAWLDLALARGAAGDAAGQEKAVDAAIRVAPTTPSVAWEAANLYLAWGKTDRAISEFRVVVDNDPAKAGAAVALCWRATHDLNVLLNRVLADRPDPYLDLIDLLLEERNVPAAEVVWAKTVELHHLVPTKRTFPLIDALIDAQQGDAAGRVWNQMVRLNSLQSYATEGNAIINGKFLEPVLNGGFDWRVRYVPGVRAELDSSEPHDGIASLAIIFEKTRTDDAGLLQYVRLMANTRYQFSAAVKARDLETASGPAFVLADVGSGRVLMTSQVSEGSFSWRVVNATFNSGPDTRIAALRLQRARKDTVIDGTLWINDVRISEAGQ